MPPGRGKLGGEAGPGRRGRKNPKVEPQCLRNGSLNHPERDFPCGAIASWTSRTQRPCWPQALQRGGQPAGASEAGLPASDLTTGSTSSRPHGILMRVGQKCKQAEPGCLRPPPPALLTGTESGGSDEALGELPRGQTLASLALLGAPHPSGWMPGVRGHGLRLGRRSPRFSSGSGGLRGREVGHGPGTPRGPQPGPPVGI